MPDRCLTLTLSLILMPILVWTLLLALLRLAWTLILTLLRWALPRISGA